MRGGAPAWNNQYGGGSPISRGPVAPDILLILGLVFSTFVLQFFQETRIVPDLLRLGDTVFRGFIWQLLTYAFTGFGPASLWFLLSLLILYWFASDIFRRLGRYRFWKLLISSILVGALVAVVIRGAGILLGHISPNAFVLMQGQYMLISIFIAAFATLFGNATIMLFFVLPIRASWFLWLEILFAFMGFLNSHDLAGFGGICAAVGSTWFLLQPGGPWTGLKNLKLRLRRMWLQKRLSRLRKRRGFDVIDGDGDWLN